MYIDVNEGKGKFINKNDWTTDAFRPKASSG